MTTMNKPTLAMIDGDLMAYKAACSAAANEAKAAEIEETFDINAWLKYRLDFDVKQWTPEGCTDVTIAISCSRKDNYRRDFWPAYKAHRDGSASPEHLGAAIQYLRDNYPTMERPRIEADDLMGMAMGSGYAIAVTLDKDLKTCPGWLWNPEKQGFAELISEQDADRAFHTQWLTGDSTDGIPGLHRLGAKGAQKMLEATPPAQWTQMVVQHYRDVAHDMVKWRKGTESFSGSRADQLRIGFGWEHGINEDFILAQANCVRILRSDQWDKASETPILWSYEG